MDAYLAAEGFNKQLGALSDPLSDSARAETEEMEFLKKLRHYLNELSIATHALETAMKGMEEAEVALLYNTYEFVKLSKLDNVRRNFLKMDHNEHLLEELKRLETLLNHIQAQTEWIEEDILTAWRNQNPRFSSMGIIDSDVQSSTLKDTALARR